MEKKITDTNMHEGLQNEGIRSESDRLADVIDNGVVLEDKNKEE